MLEKTREICLGEGQSSLGHVFHVHMIVKEGNEHGVAKIMWRDVDGKPYVPTQVERDESTSMIAEATGGAYKGSLNVGGEMITDPAEAEALAGNFFKGTKDVN